MHTPPPAPALAATVIGQDGQFYLRMERPSITAYIAIIGVKSNASSYCYWVHGKLKKRIR